MITQNYFTFPFYIPRICSLVSNWPEYLANYVLRKQRLAECRMRSGFRLLDGRTGTLAVVFIRREYGSLEHFQTIVDIGANVGSFAVYAAQSCPDAKIYCYEPERQNFASLKQNIKINELEERVSLFQCAVASCRGQRELAICGSVGNSFHAVPDTSTRQTVNCTTLSGILADQRLKTIDLLKMNCEGAEYEILESCSETDFERITNIRLEYHNLDAQSRNGDSLSRWLETRGYRIERFTRRLKQSGFIWAVRTTWDSPTQNRHQNPLFQQQFSRVVINRRIHPFLMMFINSLEGLSFE
jgi:FkbM family methyltransferase